MLDFFMLHSSGPRSEWRSEWLRLLRLWLHEPGYVKDCLDYAASRLVLDGHQLDWHSQSVDFSDDANDEFRC